MKVRVVSGIIQTLLLTSILVLAFGGRTVARTFYYNFNIAVTPESPIDSDEIEVKVSLEPSSISYNVTFGSLSQVGNQFFVDIMIYVPQWFYPMLGYEEETYYLGILPADTYSFNVTVTVTGYGLGHAQHGKSFLVALIGDIDRDGIVDIFDIGSISAHWYPGPPIGPLGYDVCADINNDLAVDIFEIGIVSAHWGQTNPTP